MSTATTHTHTHWHVTDQIYGTCQLLTINGCFSYYIHWLCQFQDGNWKKFKATLLTHHWRKTYKLLPLLIPVNSRKTLPLILIKVSTLTNLMYDCTYVYHRPNRSFPLSILIPFLSLFFQLFLSSSLLRFFRSTLPHFLSSSFLLASLSSFIPFSFLPSSFLSSFESPFPSFSPTYKHFSYFVFKRVNWNKLLTNFSSKQIFHTKVVALAG